MLVQLLITALSTVCYLLCCDFCVPHALSEFDSVGGVTGRVLNSLFVLTAIFQVNLG